MRPLIRYTVGDVSGVGVGLLAAAVMGVRRSYPECDVCVCHNQINPDRLAGIDAELIDQSRFRGSLPIEPPDGHTVTWKLYPPRLRPDAHEIQMDNDVVLFGRVPEIDSFLAEPNDALLYQGLNGSHGRFGHLVKSGMRINSGIFGLPPGYPFLPDLARTLARLGVRRWENYFDEQGLVAATLLARPHFQIVPLTRVPIIEPGQTAEGYRRCRGVRGYHFAGANRDERHQGALNYLNEAGQPPQ